VQSTDLNEEFVTITASESEVSDANAATAAANAEFKTLKETKAAEEAAHKAADQDEQDKWGSVVLVATVGVCVCIPMIGWVLRALYRYPSCSQGQGCGCTWLTQKVGATAPLSVCVQSSYRRFHSSALLLAFAATCAITKSRLIVH